MRIASAHARVARSRGHRRLLRAVIERGQLLTLSGGDRLIGRGHGTRTMYVVLSGQLHVLDGAGWPVATLSTGQIVGEIAFLLHSERTLDVQAASDGAQVVALSDGTMTALVNERGPLAAKLLHNVARTLAQRLAAMNVPQLTAHDPQATPK